MQRISVRTGTSKDKTEWRPFVDTMSTLLLVCLLIMTIVIGLSYYRVVISNYYDIQQQKIEDQNKKDQVLIDTQRKALSEDVQSILTKRKDLYNNVAKKMIEQDSNLANKIEVTDGGLSIAADTLFEYNKYKLTVKGEDMAKIFGKACFAVLDDQFGKSATDMAPRIRYFEVIGHTDNTGSDVENRELSTNRAGNFVEQMFMLNDISGEEKIMYAKYIKASGMSKFDPAEGTVANQDDLQRKGNRRIEIAIVFTDDDFIFLQKKYSSIQ